MSVVEDGDVHVDKLRKIIRSLPAAQPITDEYESQLTGKVWYRDQREHLSKWLRDYNGPGAYGRKNPSTSGRHFYQHFRCPAGLIWLAEALGEDSDRVRRGVVSVESALDNGSSQCAAFRKVVPWTRIVELVDEHAAKTPPNVVERIYRRLPGR